MTNDPCIQLAALLSTALQAAREQWAKNVMKVENEANARGLFHSSARMVQTAERLDEGLIHYRQFIFDKWTAYVRPRLPSAPPPEQAAFLGVALAAFDAAASAALQVLNSRPKPGTQISTDFSGPIRDTAARERRLLETELSLYTSTPTDTPASVFNVTTHGHSSPVNVGSGTQNQQINTAEGMSELVLALTALLDAMKDHPELREVREIVIEAKDEAAKPAPNGLKLRSILSGIKDGLQGVAALHPAWASVHRVMQMLGLVA